MTKSDLISTELNEYFFRYTDKLSDDTQLRKGFESGKDKVINFFKNIPYEQLNHRYEEDKWSIKEVFQHLIDTERIFMYRCFRIARRDTIALAGYDQNIYNEPSGAHQKSIEDLINEFTLNRNNSIALLNSLSDEDLSFVGNSSGSPMSGRGAAFIIIGHDIWHMEIIKNKYL